VIALDTNVLVRYIVRDDEPQAAMATALIETECTTETPGLVTLVVLCELVWVLRGE
jgi:predicted nucleic-acid-binding protein